MPLRPVSHVVAPTLRHGVPYCNRAWAHVCLNTDRTLSATKRKCTNNRDVETRGQSVVHPLVHGCPKHESHAERIFVVHCYDARALLLILYWAVFVLYRGPERTYAVLYAAFGKIK